MRLELESALKSVRLHWLMGTTAAIASGLLLTLEPLLALTIIDEAIMRKHRELLYVLLACMGIMALLSFLFNALGRFLIHNCEDRVRSTLQDRVIAEAISGNGQGLDIEESSAIARLLVVLRSELIRSGFQFVGTSFLILALDWRAGVLVLMGSILLSGISLALSRRIERAHAEHAESWSNLTTRARAIVSAGALVRQSQRVSECLTDVRGVRGTGRAKRLALLFWENVYQGQEIVWTAGLTILVMVITALSVMDARLTLGAYIAISIYSGQIQGHVRALLGLYKDYVTQKPMLRRLNEKHGPSACARKVFAGNLPEINGGMRVLFTGRHGNELRAVEARLVETFEGRERPVAVVAAEPVLLPGGVAENVRFGSNADESRYLAVIREAGLSEALTDSSFVAADANLEIKQRMQIARALLMKPDLVLVEDFTTSLDPRAAVELVDLLRRHCSTLVAVGQSDVLFDLVDQVTWVENGACTSVQSVEEFLSDPAFSLSSRVSTTARVTQSRAVLAQAKDWAARNGTGIKAFRVELFGHDDHCARAVTAVAKAIYSEVRGADLVVFEGRSRLKCVLFGIDAAAPLAPIERRLQLCVYRELRTNNYGNVYFTIDSVEDAWNERVAA